MNTQSLEASSAILTNSRPGSWRAQRALVALLLAGLTTLASADRPTNPPTPGPGGNPGDPGNGGNAPTLDDESIGSLPILGGGFVLLPPGMDFPGLRPNLYLEGPTQHVMDALLSATGSGVIRVEESGDGRTSIVFHGAMQVDFALASFFDDSLEVGLLTGAELGHVGAAVFYRGRMVTRTALRPLEQFELPVQAMLAIDELKSGVDLFTADVLGGRSQYRLASHGGVLTMSSLRG